jgi:hypothetical protein
MIASDKESIVDARVANVVPNRGNQQDKTIERSEYSLDAALLWCA